MLTPEEQERVTHVGRGTPAGEWLRRYWHPIALSDRWEGIKTLWNCDEPVTFKGRAGTVASHGAAVGTFTGKPTRQCRTDSIRSTNDDPASAWM